MSSPSIRKIQASQSDIHADLLDTPGNATLSPLDEKHTPVDSLPALIVTRLDLTLRPAG